MLFWSIYISYDGHFNADILYNKMQSRLPCKSGYRLQYARPITDRSKTQLSNINLAVSLHNMRKPLETTRIIIWYARVVGKVKEFSDKQIRTWAFSHATFAHFQMSHYSLISVWTL